MSSEFRLSPTYYIDGMNQSLAEWIGREVPGVVVIIETLPIPDPRDECKANVKII